MVALKETILMLIKHIDSSKLLLFGVLSTPESDRTKKPKLTSKEIVLVNTRIVSTNKLKMLMISRTKPATIQVTKNLVFISIS